MNTPAFWRNRSPLSDALVPLSWLYGVGAQTAAKLRRPSPFPIPVITLGNATAGGGGKTPTALHLGRMLATRRVAAFFLSRGYGGTHTGPLRVDASLQKAHEVGDEPLLLARVLPTVVARDRVRGADYALSLGAQALILDDGFQSQPLESMLSLLVVDGAVGFGNGRLLPAGPLREPVAQAFARADAVIYLNPAAPLPTDKQVLTARRVLTLPFLPEGKPVVAFCGLAYPEKFFTSLEEAGVALAEKMPFPDHHRFTYGECHAFEVRAAHTTLITTAKDYARLPEHVRKLVTVAELSLCFDDEAALAALLAPIFAAVEGM